MRALCDLVAAKASAGKMRNSRRKLRQWMGDGCAYIVYQPMHKLQPGVNVHDCLYNKSNCYSNHAQTQMCNAHIMHKVGNPIDCCFLRPEMGKWRLFSKNILHRNESGIINGPCKHQPGYLKYRISLIYVNMNENTNTNVDTNTNT